MVPGCCPGCARTGALAVRLVPTTQEICGEEIVADVEKWACGNCGASFMSPAQATEAVKRAVRTYQVKHGLFTADEIRAGRQRLGISVGELADASEIGEATVKRLEAGTTVQRAGTNKLLQMILHEEAVLPDYKIDLNCTDVAGLCLPPQSQWDDEKPWNGSNGWDDLVSSILSTAADSNELALAA